MKKLTIFLLVLALVCSIGWVFAQEKTVNWEEHLKLAKSHATAQIALRQSQIQRIQDQIDIWQNQLAGIEAELKKINEEKNKEKAKTKK